MIPYHKIQSVFKRDERKKMLHGEWSRPEIEYLADNMWEFTEKVDGTNIRIGLDKGQSVFGGKTDAADIPPLLRQELTRIVMAMPDVAREAISAKNPVTLYGEGYGAKMAAGSGNYSRTPKFVLFDVNVRGWWLRRDDVCDVATQLGLDVVPVVGYGTLYDAMDRVSDGKMKSSWGNFIAEGIVARPTTPLCSRAGHRIITKIKSKDFTGEYTHSCFKS